MIDVVYEPWSRGRAEAIIDEIGAKHLEIQTKELPISVDSPCPHAGRMISQRGLPGSEPLVRQLHSGATWRDFYLLLDEGCVLHKNDLYRYFDGVEEGPNDRLIALMNL